MRDRPRKLKDTDASGRDPTYWQYPLWGLPIAIMTTTVDWMLLGFADLAAESYCQASCDVPNSATNFKFALVGALFLYLGMFLIPPNRRLRRLRAALLTLTALVAWWPAMWVLAFHNPFI